ncbi:DUF1850 domain-containing protein [Gracilinema caldarium]|uniref:DUF1850 domain-containing protein n=1 Tax=Gracilinema caldarium TaxID=215591 RepID=UPI00350E48FB
MRRFVIIFILLFPLSSLLAQNTNGVTALCVSQAGKTLAELILPENGEFILTYTHSIHKRPVYEYYRAESGMLHLYELRYDTTSTGMPSDSEGGFRIENGFFVLTMNRWFIMLPIFISPIPGHGVIINERLYPFTTWAQEETAIELSCNSVTHKGFP